MGNDERTKEKHESFGLLDIARTTGSARALCGSSIKHNNTVTIRIKRAEKERGLNRTVYFSREELIEIEMSPTQFTDALTNMNTTGVPITIRRVAGKKMEKCPFNDTYKEFEDEFSSDIKNLLGNTAKMMKLVEGKLKATGTISKAERLELASILYRIEQDIMANLPFVQEQFNRQVDKTVLEAKGEIEAFFNNTIYQLGSDKLIEELENGTIKLPIGDLK